MKKKTGHRNTWQIRPFAYDTKYNAGDKSCFTEGHVLPCSCGHSTRFSVYGIPVHFVSRMYQGWWPGYGTDYYYYVGYGTDYCLAESLYVYLKHF